MWMFKIAWTVLVPEKIVKVVPYNTKVVRKQEQISIFNMMLNPRDPITFWEWLEPKYLAGKVILHPNHHLTFGDWIPREIPILESKFMNLQNFPSLYRLHMV